MSAIEELVRHLGLSLGALCELLALGRATTRGGTISSAERREGRGSDWVVVTLSDGSVYHIAVEKK